MMFPIEEILERNTILLLIIRLLKDKISVFKAKGWHFGAGDTDASSYQREMTKLIQSFFDKFLKETHVDLMQQNSDVIIIKTTKD